MTRDVGGSDRAFTSEFTQIDPPRSWAVRGVDSPVWAAVKVTVEPQPGRASHVAISVDFSGHGLGKVLLPG